MSDRRFASTLLPLRPCLVNSSGAEAETVFCYVKSSRFKLAVGT